MKNVAFFTSAASNGSHVALAQHLLVVLVGLAASVGMAT